MRELPCENLPREQRSRRTDPSPVFNYPIIERGDLRCSAERDHPAAAHPMHPILAGIAF